MTNKISSFPASSSIAPLHRYGGVINSNSELSISAIGDTYFLEGSGTVRSLPAWPKGPPIHIHVTGKATFVSSSKLVMPGSLNYTFSPGDSAWLLPIGDGVWRVIDICRADGMPIISTVSYPDFWNGSFSLWQRGTVFTFNGGTQSPNYGQYTADCCSNGAGTGGVATVQKYTLNQVEQAAITPSINPPQTAQRMTWTTAPTAGAGQSGYPAYASFIELKGNNVPNYAGKQVTISCWIRCATSQSLKFYLYVAMGGLTATGHLGSNTIVGTAAGVDCTTAGDTEIFARSAQMTTAVGPTWQRFSYTLTLDNLQAATFSSSPVMNIGIGMDYTDITNTTDVYVTALNLDPGPAVMPWREWPDEAKWSMAAYNFQRIGMGAVGYCVSTTTIQISVNMKGVIKANGAGGGGLFAAPGVNPSISCSNSASFTGSSSAITVIAASAYGMFLNVTGFTGLTAGASCVMSNDWLYTAQG